MPGTSSASCVKRGIITPEAWKYGFNTPSSLAMRSSSVLDGACSLATAFGLWYNGWWWCALAMVLVGLVNFAVKGQEVYAGWSLAKRVATAVARLEAEPPMEWALGRKFLVLLNPNAGAGRGGMIFAKCVRPVLEAAQVDFDTVETERAGHASDICCGLGAQGKMARGGVSYDAVVCVSGDGMLHEAINGFAKSCGGNAEILERILSKVVLAVVPAGSANGVAASLGASDPLQATLNIACGRPTAVDVMSVKRLSAEGGSGPATLPPKALKLLGAEAKHPADPPVFDVHFFCWAAFSDHDWLIEKPLRAMGPLVKMILAPLIVIARGKHYHGEVGVWGEGEGVWGDGGREEGRWRKGERERGRGIEDGGDIYREEEITADVFVLLTRRLCLPLEQVWWTYFQWTTTTCQRRRERRNSTSTILRW